MPTKNGRNYTGTPGLNLRESNGALRFETPLITPTTTSGERLLYVNSSNQLVYDDGSSAVVVGAAGGGVLPTWETIFAADTTFTITPDSTFTIAGNRSTATDVITVTNIAGGSGSCIQITNAGTGNDIDGTSNTWSITKAGVITATGLTLSGANTITSTAGDITWTLEDNDATALKIGASGATSMITFVTTNGSEAVVFGNGMTLTDGKFTATSTSNTVPLFLLQNDTITTFGVGSTEDEGCFVFSSDTLTTGDLIRLQLDESALNGGAFIKCVQTDAAAAVFTIGEGGAVTIAGAGGSNYLTVTAGDVVFSDASLAITDADNAASFTVTNNTATTASVIVIAGSGVFTGTTTSSFMTITPSGLTTGTGVYLPVAGMTSGTAFSIVAATANFTTGGTLLSLSSTAAVAGNHLSIATTGVYTGTGMLIMSAGAMTTGVMVSLTSTTGLTSGSLIRATTSTAGAIATNGVISFTASGIFTSTSNCGFVNITANATTAGTVLAVNATGLVAGIGIYMPSAEAGLTTGKYVSLGGVFTVSKYGATVIAGNASGTAALTLTAGDLVVTSGFVVLSANAKGITFTGTGANGGILKNLKNAATSALSGTQKDIEIDIAGVPYYFTVYPTKA
jgi:hypothetical protein